MTLSRPTIATLSLILVAILFIAVNLALDTFLRSARIDLTENQIHTLISDKRAQTVQRSAIEVVPARMSGRHVIPDKRIVGSGHDVER